MSAPVLRPTTVRFSRLCGAGGLGVGFTYDRHGVRSQGTFQMNNTCLSPV